MDDLLNRKRYRGERAFFTNSLSLYLEFQFLRSVSLRRTQSRRRCRKQSPNLYPSPIVYITMSNSPSKPDPPILDSNPGAPLQDPVNGEDIEEEVYEHDLEAEDQEEEEEEEEEELSTGTNTRDSMSRLEKLKTEAFLQRMKNGPISLRVHDVIIQGNTKTKEHVIEAETAPLMDVRTLQDLVHASNLVNSRLQSLGIFDSVKITIDSGPPELPATANVIIDVTEAGNPLTGDIGVYTKPEVGLTLIGVSSLRDYALL